MKRNSFEYFLSIKIPTERGNSPGRALKDIATPDESIISLVISRDGNAAIPNEDTLIQPGDEVVAVTTAQAEAELRDLLVNGFEE